MRIHWSDFIETIHLQISLNSNFSRAGKKKKDLSYTQFSQVGQKQARGWEEGTAPPPGIPPTAVCSSVARQLQSTAATMSPTPASFRDAELHG